MNTKRVVNLLNMGDLAAPKGTASWCIAVREEARSALQSAKSTREQVQSWVSALREDDRFRQLTDKGGNRFLTWDSFCEEPPPYGFGMSAMEVDALIESKPQRQASMNAAAKPETKVPEGKHGALPGNQNARKTEFTKSENVNSVSETESKGGNRKEYRIRRMRKDYGERGAEAADRLERGEFKSTAAAERWARGEEPHPAYPKKTDLMWLEHWWNKADDDTKQEFLDKNGLQWQRKK